MSERVTGFVRCCECVSGLYEVYDLLKLKCNQSKIKITLKNLKTIKYMNFVDLPKRKKQQINVFAQHPSRKQGHSCQITN